MTVVTVLTMAALAAGTGAVSAQSPSAAAPAATGYAELDQAMGADQPFKGTQVTMQTQWITGEGDNFAKALQPFQDATGIVVKVAEVPSGQHETLVNLSLNGGQAADIIALAQPSAIDAYGDKGLLKDINTILDGKKLADEHAATIGLYTSGDHVWAIPYKVDVKSVVWYPIKAFEAKGYKIPTTWDELLALSDQIVADGGVPWCIAMESGAATGWIATDWIEDIMLRTAGVDAFNKWATHELPFNSPEVKAAWELAGKIFFNPAYVAGGSTGILATSFLDAMDPMFNDDLANPGCWMQKQATWYGPDEFPDQKATGQPSKYVVGEDVGLFYFPAIDPAQGTPALGAGDALMVTQDRPEVRALAQYLATPEGIKAWIDAGSAISANQTTPADWYQSYKLKVASEIVANATSFGFDASDVMPASGKAFWDGVSTWIANDGAGLDDVLAAIDADPGWTAAQ